MAHNKKMSQDDIDNFVLNSHESYGKVRRFLILHPDVVNQRSSWGETALDAAKHAGQTDIVALLKSAGASAISECSGCCKAPVERLDNDNLNV